jgi:hypothetical protein
MNKLAVYQNFHIEGVRNDGGWLLRHPKLLFSLALGAGVRQENALISDIMKTLGIHWGYPKQTAGTYFDNSSYVHLNFIY